MKRIISVIIAIVTAFCIFAVTGSAKGDWLYELTSLSIISGDEEGNLNLENTMTRAELVSCVSRLMGYDEIAESYKTDVKFSDVENSDWFADEVNLMATLGIIHGTTKDKFEPMAEIQYEQAVKIMINILGYGKVAEEQGGYPSGYMNLASRLGLLKNVKASPFTRESVMRIIYNALDVNILEDMGTGTFETNGNTLRKNLMEKTPDETLFEESGIVTADADTYLITADSSFFDDEIEIDGRKYKARGINTFGFLGQKVDFYAKVDSYGDYELISIKLSDDNTVTKIDERDFIRIEGEKLHYYKNENQKTQLSISSSCKFVKNGRLLKKYTASDLTLQKGTVTAIDNNSDRAVDVIFIEDYSNVRVDEVSGNTIVLAGNDRIDGKKYFTVDPEDDSVRVVIFDKDNNRITVDLIQPDSVMSVVTSSDATFIKLIVTNDTQEGVINEITNEEILIDDEYYNIHQNERLNISVGDSAVVYFDFRGYAAFAEKISIESNYAYVLSSARDEELYDCLNIKMIMGSKIEMHYTKNEENLDDTDLIPSIICKNSDVRKLQSAEKLKVDGVRFEGENIPSGLYKYTLNQNGQIRTLETPVFAGGGNAMKYNVYDKTFGQNTANVPIAIDDETIVVCIPKNNGASLRDLMLPLEIDDKETTRTFDVFGYDYDEDTKKTKIIVFKEYMQSEMKPVIDPVSSSPAVALVKRAKLTIDSDDDLYLELVLLTNGGEVTFNVKDINAKNSFFKDLKNGDVIYYAKGIDGNIANYKLVCSLKNIEKAPFYKNKAAVNEQIFGRVTNIEYDEIDNKANRLVNTIDLMSETSLSVNVNKRNAPPVFIYNSGGGEALKGSIEDIIPGDKEEYLYILRPYSTNVRVLVVVR